MVLQQRNCLKRLPKSVNRAYGDGGYDGFEFRKAVHEKGAKAIVPPPKNAAVHADSPDDAVQCRNNAIYEIIGLGGEEQGRKSWKILSGYHKRSLVENTFYRIKQLMGDKFFSRLWDNQRTESHLKCFIINKMNSLEIPKGMWEIAC